jgi:glycosyltransferase involved in cell wall biosynthesis
MMRRKNILLLHLAGRIPLAGVAWQTLHHAIALQRLGYDVHYIEDSGAPPYDPRVRSVADDCSYNVDFLKQLMDRCGLKDRWAYWDMSHNAYYGLDRSGVRRAYQQADAIFNLCAATRLREEHLICPVRIYVQTDPVYEQIKEAQGDQCTVASIGAHTHHFTYGENLGYPDCRVPLDGFNWKVTRPPVLLDLWEYRFNPEAENFTTVTVWRNTGKDIIFDGDKYYWSKHLNFIHFQDLPRRTSQRFELALDADPGTTTQPLKNHGWFLVDAYEKSCDLGTYRDYIYGSRGEFTVSKDLVVRTQSGWFSDRSVCYLAAGKPVVTQETGFSKFISTGRGLFSFANMDEAAAAFEEINSDYAGHCEAAREIAAEYFSAEKVLGKLLQEVGI